MEQYIGRGGGAGGGCGWLRAGALKEVVDTGDVGLKPRGRLKKGKMLYSPRSGEIDKD